MYFGLITWLRSNPHRNHSTRTLGYLGVRVHRGHGRRHRRSPEDRGAPQAEELPGWLLQTSRLQRYPYTGGLSGF